MSHTYRFSLFVRRGVGGGFGLRCTVWTCIHMEKFLPLYSRDLDAPDRYQNIPIYLWLIHCTLSHNSWTDRQYFKKGTEKHRQSTLWWFWYWFCKKKIQQSCACILFRRWSVAVKILVYTRFQYVNLNYVPGNELHLLHTNMQIKYLRPCKWRYIRGI